MMVITGTLAPTQPERIECGANLEPAGRLHERPVSIGACAIHLGIKTNVDRTFEQLGQAFASVTDVAMPRAINTLRDQAQVAGLREIANQYDVGPRTMEQYVSVTFATPTELEATISVKGRGFSLADMKPRQTSSGVSVSVKGKRFVIPGTFLATMKSGHVGVFARGAYGDKSARALRATGSFGRFTFGRGERVKRANEWGSSELPINELFTWAPPDAFASESVTAAMQDRIDEQAPTVIAREIKAATHGF